MIGLTVIFGAMIYPQYAITVAHANDFAAPDEFVKIAGGLLLLLGIGTMIGPFLAAQAMEHFIPEGLFAFTAASHLLLGLYTLFRMTRRGAPSGPAFRGVSVAKGGATPESVGTRPALGRCETRGCGGSAGPRRPRHRPRGRGAGRGAAPGRGSGTGAGDDRHRAGGAAVLARDAVEPRGCRPSRKRHRMRHEPTPATDDEVAPPAPDDGGTEPPR